MVPLWAGWLTGEYFFNIFVENFVFRVAGAGFELRGVNYTLAANNGAHSLHGGTKGWDRRVWNCEVVEGGVVFSRLSSDGEEVGVWDKKRIW